MTEASAQAGLEPPLGRPDVRPGVPGLDELARFVEQTLARPATSALTAIVLPAPRGEATNLLDVLARTDAFALAPQAGPDVVALGATARVRLAGPRRFADAREALARLFSSIDRASHPAAPAISPRAFVGFSFAPGSSDREPWRELGDGLVLLPRWTYFALPEPVLVCILDRTHDHAGRTALVRSELEAIFAALAMPPSDRRPARTTLAPEAPALHAARVEGALSTIRRGEATKIVVSRHAAVTAPTSFDAGTTYRALVRGARRGGTAFLVRRGTTTFVGATPELLLSRRGDVLRTMALAGTAAPNGPDLLRSEKDLAEHRVVVEAICDALGPLARLLERDTSPRVTQAGPMVHLRTSIAATLEPGIDALEVASRLHPTPAVAGAPREVATKFIERAEPGRGWYAGPLGWIDANGDAELVVALRAGLLRGGRAVAYAGGGIVEGSHAESERAETELKMRPFLEALGVELS